MRKLFSMILIFSLLATCMVNLFACSNDNSDKDNSDKDNSDKDNSNYLPPSISTEDEIEPTIIELTKYNYSSYLNISINQTAQSQILISNTYYVKYQLNFGRYEFRYYTGLTPPTTKDVLQCTYLYSTYSVSTTFTINCRSKNNDYTFSNSNFSIVYRSSPSQFSSVTVYVSQDGNGSNVFMMSEELSSPNKSYFLQVTNMIGDFNGEVSFFENN